VSTQADLQAHLEEWKTPLPVPEDPEDTRLVGHPVGMVVLMEGADAIRTPDELEPWWEAGLRIIGLAWVGTRYSGGTGEPGPLTPEGFELLEAMADVGFALDISHMDSKAALQAIERYPGTIIASHANPLGMMRGSESNRFLPDAVIDLLLERDGVIGAMPNNRFMSTKWTPEDGKASITLELFADHIDYLCQRAGDARHVGIGSDFDGGFGRESTPFEIDTVADLQKAVSILLSRGYSEKDVEAIFSGNWLRKLQEFLPKS
jgi:membrane dipeptidase